ncbi:MAG: hypothetical protein AAF546_09450 [Verrucomicrobiota bacterium]
MMKKSALRTIAILGIFALSQLNAAYFVDFRTGDQSEVASFTLTFDVGTGAIVSGFDVTDPTVTGSFGGSSTGTFSITFTALGEGTGGSIDPANWAFTPATGSAFQQSTGANNGFGIVSDDQTGTNFNNPEGVLFDIDTSGVTFAPGQSLQLDSILVRDTNNQFELWKQTGATSGVNTFSDGGTTDIETWVIASPFNQIADGDSYVLRDVGSGQKRFQGITFSVIPEPSSAFFMGFMSLWILSFSRRIR